MRYLLLALLLPGCMGLTPSVMGKTQYNVEFSDVTEDQNTQYKMNIKAPAGVDLASVTGMTYKWQPDGSGNISVSNDNNVNTETQAVMLTEINAQQTQALLQSMQMMQSILVPFLSDYNVQKTERLRLKETYVED